MDSETFKLAVLGALAATLVASVATFLYTSPQLYVNGTRPTDLSTQVRNGELYVALPHGARIMGGEVEAISSSGAWIRTGRDDSNFLTGDDLINSGGTYYADLESLLASMDTSCRKVGSSFRVTTRPAELSDYRLSGDALLLRFDGFVPYEVTKKSSRRIVLRLFNVSVDQNYLSGSGVNPIRNVRFKASSDNSVRATLSLNTSQPYSANGLSIEEGFRLLLMVGGTSKESPLPSVEPQKPSPPSTTPDVGQELAEGLTYHTIVEHASATAHTIHYLKAENWSQNYRLRVAVPTAGLGHRRPLSALVSGNLGVAGINANFFDPPTGVPIGLVVKNGKVLSDNWGSRAALAIDYFGDLHFARPSVSLKLIDGSRSVSIEDINRPVGADELVIYTSGYSGPVLGKYASGKRVVALRNGRVVSTGRSLVRDGWSHDYVIVGTGSKRAGLRRLQVGDKVKFDWSMQPYVPMVRDAVSAGPLLIQNGRNVLNISRESFSPNTPLVESSATRSVVAKTSDGSLLLMVIKNRGISLRKLPDLLLSADLGVSSAMALDGGNSAGLAFQQGVQMKEIGCHRDIPVGLVLIPK